MRRLPLEPLPADELEITLVMPEYEGRAWVVKLTVEQARELRRKLDEAIKVKEARKN